MVGDTAHPITFASQIANHSRQIGKQRRPNLFAQHRPAIFCTEDEMNNDQGKRAWHASDYRSGLQPSDYLCLDSWGLAPRWYRNAPFALAALAVLTVFTGCKSSPNTKTTTLAEAAKDGKISDVHIYPSRPTITPPPFKVFHTTDNSITLVTSDNASDEQIEAIIWQLHEAAHTHSFDKLRISQKLVDKRDPMIWFHVYRGPKCADEKYTTGKLPCGASYHAAGDYTLGSFSNPNHDDGVLLHDENHQTELWNPDAPPTALTP